MSQTRHNVGFMFLDYLARRLGQKKFENSKKLEAEVLKTDNWLLVKPQTFMNNSGRSVAKTINFYKHKFSQSFLVYDDLDIGFGKVKAVDKGPKKHNGVNSVLLGTTEKFVHLRIGILGESYFMIKGRGESVADDYILKEFSKEEKKKLEVIWERAWERLEKEISKIEEKK